MKFDFLNIFIDKDNLHSVDFKFINPFVKDFNKLEIEQIYDFYGDSDKNFLYLNGFVGVGKKQVINYANKFLANNVILLQYNCSEITMLDDIFLSFFNVFKSLESQGIISEPKNRIENFIQKINSYFSSIEMPFLIVLHSVDLLTKENASEIVSFLSHVAKFSKIKIIFTARSYKDYLIPQNVNESRILIKGFDKDTFNKFLRANKIYCNSSQLDLFYKHTRGYFFYTVLALNLIAFKNQSIEEFLKDFVASCYNFNSYIVKEYQSLIPRTAFKFFWFLFLIRHSVSEEVLISLDLYDKKNIESLIENKILTYRKGHYSLNDFFKLQAEIVIPDKIELSLHKMIIDLYESQLPLKPSERKLQLSRQSMRSEIVYHKHFLPQEPKSTSVIKNLEYMTYTSQVATNRDYDDVQQVPELPPIPVAEKYRMDETEVYQASVPFEIELEVEDYMAHALEFISAFDYEKALDSYNTALSLQMKKNDRFGLAILYKAIADCYKKIPDKNNALKYYNRALELKIDNNNFVANVNYEIADIYFELYKVAQAYDLYNEILKDDSINNHLKIAVYLKLMKFDNVSPRETYIYAKKVVELLDADAPDYFKAECYFNYAAACDDVDEVDTAIKYYKKCVEEFNNPVDNKYFAESCTNIANYENKVGNLSIAIEYYQKAFKSDTDAKNYDGMYYTSLKLAQIIQKKLPDKALNYYLKAKECANLSEDKFSVVVSTIALGDYYFSQKRDELSLREYFSILKLVKKEFSSEYIAKMEKRMNEIRFRIGDVRYNNILKDYQ